MVYIYMHDNWYVYFTPVLLLSIILMTGNKSLQSIEPIPRGRPPGRPRKQYRSSGRHAANASLMRSSLESLVVPSQEIPCHLIFKISNWHFLTRFTIAGAQPYPSQPPATTTAPVLSEIQVLSTQVEMERRRSHGVSQPVSFTNNARFFLNTLDRSNGWQ